MSDYVDVYDGFDPTPSEAVATCSCGRTPESPCEPCRSLLGSDLVADMERDVAAARAEDEATERDLSGYGIKRADGGF